MRRSLALTLAAIALPGIAHAQDFQRVIPKAPPPTETPRVETPPVEAPAPDDQTVLVPTLAGLVFVDRADVVRREGVAPDSVPGGINAAGLAPLTAPSVSERLQPFLGKPLTRAGLDAIARIAREAYRASDRPFVDVSVPPQNVRTGVIQLVVTEYRLGALSVTGNKHFSERLIRGMGDLETGETLTLPRLRKALDDYNQNPFLTVSAVAQPGRETGFTDIVLEAKDRLPFRAYAGYDNQGTPLLGRDEWYVGANWGNVFGTGQILSYQFTRSFEGGYTSHSASDVIPIGPDDRVLLFGAYAIQKPDLGEIFSSTGHSGQLSGRYVHDLAGSSSVRHSIQFGIDYKRTDNNLDFLGFRILDTDVEVFQLPVTYSGGFTDSSGRTVIENMLVLSPGNITAHNNDAALRQLVPDGDMTYAYDRLSVTRTFFLPYKSALVLRGMVQLATGNLPYSEQVGGGGIGGVRGYDPNAALGSNGVILSTELRSPPFSLFGKGGKLEDNMQLGAFIDYAYLTQPTPFPDLPRDTQLASIGVNLHYTVGRYLDLQVELGSQLRRAPGASQRKTRAAIVATIGF